VKSWVHSGQNVPFRPRLGLFLCFGEPRYRELVILFAMDVAGRHEHPHQLFGYLKIVQALDSARKSSLEITLVVESVHKRR
jgi:hypothetical protein